MFTNHYNLPPGLLEAEAHELQELLGGPALIRLEGRREPPLFVSVLLHGNEPVGFEALKLLLPRYSVANGGKSLPRSLVIFIGNVAAAARGVRRLEGQPDFNRVWPGSELPATPEHDMMAAVVAELHRSGVFASIDIHNNTGLNPHYACLNALDSRFLHLATLFGRTVVYFRRPTGVQSMAFSALCPAVTLECGRVGQSLGVEHASDYLEACLNLSHIPEHPVAEHDIDLFHTVAVVRVPQEVSFGFGVGGVDIDFAEDIDRLNFRELPRGTVLASLGPQGAARLEVRDEAGGDVCARYFSFVDGELRTRLPLMPSMLTRDRDVVRQDCLCYLMERYHYRALPDGGVDIGSC